MRFFRPLNTLSFSLLCICARVSSDSASSSTDKSTEVDLSGFASFSALGWKESAESTSESSKSTSSSGSHETQVPDASDSEASSSGEEAAAGKAAGKIVAESLGLGLALAASLRPVPGLTSNEAAPAQQQPPSHRPQSLQPVLRSSQGPPDIQSSSVAQPSSVPKSTSKSSSASDSSEKPPPGLPSQEGSAKNTARMPGKRRSPDSKAYRTKWLAQWKRAQRRRRRERELALRRRQSRRRRRPQTRQDLPQDSSPTDFSQYGGVDKSRVANSIEELVLHFRDPLHHPPEGRRAAAATVAEELACQLSLLNRLHEVGIVDEAKKATVILNLGLDAANASVPCGRFNWRPLSELGREKPVRMDRRRLAAADVGRCLVGRARAQHLGKRRRIQKLRRVRLLRAELREAEEDLRETFPSSRLADAKPVRGSGGTPVHNDRLRRQKRAAASAGDVQDIEYSEEDGLTRAGRLMNCRRKGRPFQGQEDQGRYGILCDTCWGVRQVKGGTPAYISDVVCDPRTEEPTCLGGNGKCLETTSSVEVLLWREKGGHVRVPVRQRQSCDCRVLDGSPLWDLVVM